MKKILFGLLTVFSQLQFSAAAQNNTYNANTSVQITEVVTYTDEGTILFKTSAQPTISGCNGSHFIIPGTISAENRQMILSRVLTARAMRETIFIGYDGQSCGPLSFIRAYRVG